MNKKAEDGKMKEAKEIGYYAEMYGDCPYCGLTQTIRENHETEFRNTQKCDCGKTFMPPDWDSSQI